jgi:hypothetical protein
MWYKSEACKQGMRNNYYFLRLFAFTSTDSLSRPKD